MDYPDRKISNNEKQMPFVEKFMVPQLYDLFKFGGGTAVLNGKNIFACHIPMNF